MKALLVHIASFAVMVHMTFGCSLHHGLGTNACAHQNATVCEHHADSTDHRNSSARDEHAHHHVHDHDQPLDSELPSEADAADLVKGDRHNSHAGCCDDGCHVTQSVQFQFAALDFLVPCPIGADTLALIERQNFAGITTGPVPDCQLIGASVRAHLLLGVQIL